MCVRESVCVSLPPQQTLGAKSHHEGGMMPAASHIRHKLFFQHLCCPFFEACCQRDRGRVAGRERKRERKEEVQREYHCAHKCNFEGEPSKTCESHVTWNTSYARN